jgi:uncharacterized protein (TIGR03067 family)
MYVVFDADQRTVLQIRRLVLEEKKAGKAPTEFPVRCALADDKDFPYRGKLESVDVPIDPKTGAATWRALLPNPEGILMPGLFVRVRLFISAPHKAMLIPEQAIGADQGQKFVYVVADKVVQYRRIQVGTLEDGLRVVNEGLTADDWVVTAQVSKLRPGMIVTPQPAPSPAAPSPAAGPAVSPVADLKALEGQWKVVRVEKGKDADFNWTDILYGGGLVRVEGEKLYDPTGADRFAFTESGDGWQFQVRNSETTGMAGLVPMLWFCGGNSFRIDPSAAPKTIDLMGDSNRLVAVGIYEIDGDRLKLCLSRYLAALKSEQRPESFTVAPASEDISFVLERFHPPQDEKTIQGTWKITEQVEDGKPLSEEQRRRKSCWTGPDLLSCMTKMADGKTKSEAGMNFVLDTSKQPRWITLFQGGLVEPRKNKWEVLPGIYKFEGERLSIAYRKDGPRPEKFESPAGSGITLLVLERTKPPEMKGGMGQGGGMGMY